ncbi:MAG: hypothetical protein EPO25_11100 [Gammaproteobacteria bacterium]|nr:MAG: hypothetical protein EPO25_11100 [Gammaproteobacteria bacterium]
MQPSAVSRPAPSTGSRVRFTHTQVYRAALEDVFPLLCPVREYEYLPQWQCRIVRLDSGLIEEGGVFTTEDGGDVWVVARYVSNKSIRFIRVNAWRTMSYSIDVQPAPPGEVRLHWEQVITGLDAEGNRQVEVLRESDFRQMLDGMQALLQHYLDSGAMRQQ